MLYRTQLIIDSLVFTRIRFYTIKCADSRDRADLLRFVCTI